VLIDVPEEIGAMTIPSTIFSKEALKGGAGKNEGRHLKGDSGG